MNEARVRLIFHDSLGTRERLAALGGARTFARFGVVCDCADAGDRKALRPVKFGERLSSIVSDPHPVLRPEDFAHGSPWALVFTKNIYGLGVTPRPIRLQQDGKAELCCGLGRSGVGGVLSTDPFRTDGTLEGDRLQVAIAAGVRHELGHVFGISPHCTDGGCIMQANDNYADFVGRFVKPGLDFCRGCQAKISTAVSRARFGR